MLFGLLHASLTNLIGDLTFLKMFVTWAASYDAQMTFKEESIDHKLKNKAATTYVVRAIQMDGVYDTRIKFMIDQ